MILKQIKHGGLDNFSYLVGCSRTRKALVIDPPADADEMLGQAADLRLNIELIVNTHGHGDHTAGNISLKARTGARIAMHREDADRFDQVDIRLEDGERVCAGDVTLEVIHTPGHTPGGICLYGEGQLFTGDTLFVGDSGRTDLAGGDRPALGASLRKLMKLPSGTVVWPGHDYGHSRSTTLAREKRENINAREYGFYAE